MRPVTVEPVVGAGSLQCMTTSKGVPTFIGGGALLQVVCTTASDHQAIAVSGELDRETTPRLATVLHRAIAEAPERIELDLSGVTFMDSQGLRILLEAKRRAGDDIEIVVTETSAQVERLLHTTGVADVLGLASR